MSVVHGRHTFRFGLDFLRQLARQHPPFNERGSFGYFASGSVTSFSNFLDDFGGDGGSLNRQFGSSIYHPISSGRVIFSKTPGRRRRT